MSGYDKIEKAMCDYIYEITGEITTSFLAMRNATVLTKVLTHLDKLFFTAVLEKMTVTPLGSDPETEQADNQNNWMTFVDSIALYTQKNHINDVELDCSIIELSQGKGSELTNIFMLISTLFLMKSPTVWEVTLNSISDTTSVNVLKKIQQTVEYTHSELEFRDKLNIDSNTNKMGSPSKRESNNLTSMGNVGGVAPGNARPGQDHSMVLNVMGKLEDDLEDAHNEIQELKLQLMDSNQTSSDLKNQLKDKTKHVESLSQKLEAIKNDPEGRYSILGGDIASSRIHKEITDLKDRLKIAEEQIDETEYRNSQLRETKIAYENEIRKLKMQNVSVKDSKNYKKMNQELVHSIEVINKEKRSLEFRCENLLSQTKLMDSSKKKLQQMLEKANKTTDKQDKDLRFQKRQINEKVRELKDLENTVNILRQRAEDSKSNEEEEAKKKAANKKRGSLVKTRSLLEEIGQNQFGDHGQSEFGVIDDELEYAKFELNLMKKDKAATYNSEIAPLRKKVDEFKIENKNLEDKNEELKNLVHSERLQATKVSEELTQLKLKYQTTKKGLDQAIEELDFKKNDKVDNLASSLDPNNRNHSQSVDKTKADSELSLLYSIMVDNYVKKNEESVYVQRKAQQRYEVFDDLLSIAGI